MWPVSIWVSGLCVEVAAPRSGSNRPPFSTVSRNALAARLNEPSCSVRIFVISLWWLTSRSSLPGMSVAACVDIVRGRFDFSGEAGGMVVVLRRNGVLGLMSDLGGVHVSKLLREWPARGAGLRLRRWRMARIGTYVTRNAGDDVYTYSLRL